MSHLRSFLSILAGYILMFFLTGVCTAALLWGLHMRPDRPAYFCLNVVYTLAAAFLGGLVTAKFAPRSPWTHGIILAAVVMLVSLVMAFHSGTGQPVWYRIFLVIFPPLAALYGASRMGSKQAA